MAYENLMNELESGTSHLVIDGSGGSGKTVTNNQFRVRTKRNVLFSATTGLAASHIEASTIHSAFGFHSFHQICDPYFPLRIQDQAFTLIDTLLIDEVSMLHSFLLDAMDKRLQFIRNNTLPFGGVRIVFSGDHYQISPVITDEINYHLEGSIRLPTIIFSQIYSQILSLSRPLDSIH